MKSSTCNLFDESYNGAAYRLETINIDGSIDACQVIQQCASYAIDGEGSSFRLWYYKVNGYWGCDVGYYTYNSGSSGNGDNGVTGGQYIYSL